MINSGSLKISICIPQYNRIQYLLKSLSIIQEQTYSNIEIIISDDCSTDDTESKIKELIPKYKYPIIYSRNGQNLGYDRNYRKCIEYATGEYVFILGNDDTLYSIESIQFLVDFLKSNDLPDIGFCNYVEEKTPGVISKRASKTGILGKGSKVALKYYSCFSFVGGLIYKKSVFDNYNTPKHDGSIYAQMYLGCLIIANDAILFSIKEPLVIKDIIIDNHIVNSYKDVIAKKWKDYKIEDGGLPSIINVLIDAFKDAGTLNQNIVYHIFFRIYSITYPYWIVDYKSNNALPAAIGLIYGLNPLKNENFTELNIINRGRIFITYLLFSALGLFIPVSLFNKIKGTLYRIAKK